MLNNVIFAIQVMAEAVLVYLTGNYAVNYQTNDTIIDQRVEQQNELQLRINPLVNDYGSRVSVVIKNLDNGAAYSYQENEVYDSASLYKLWIMGTLYRQIQEGTVVEDKIKTRMHAMITISDNDSAYQLTKVAGLSNTADYIKSIGLENTNIGSDDDLPKTTAYDVAVFFEKLYNGELANNEYTNKMLETLKKQQLNHKLPRLLPEGTTIAHKTGELYQVSHDAGIVYSPNGTYVIAVLTENPLPASANDLIAEISKAVYYTFNEVKQ